MSADPLVTGILIFLNGEAFLAEAIDSVLAQSLADWELLLCDDGSTDGATAIAKRYAAEHPGRIRYLEHPGHENRGMSATRNLGIRHARGEYVAMLDADDVWTPTKLEEQVAILDKHPEAAMVYGRMKLWHSWTGKPQDDRRDALQPLGVAADAVAAPPELLLAFLRDPSCHACGLLTRKAVLDEVGGYEEEFRGEYEDVIVQSKIALEHPVYASNRCWYWYRQHDDSCTAATRRQWQQRPARLKFLNKLEQHLIGKSVTSGPVWEEVRRQLRPFRNRLRYAAEGAARRGGLAARAVAKRFLPRPAVARARALWWGHGYTPPFGWVNFGDLRRTAPVARDFGSERGTPVDRYYVERFLRDHAADIRGTVLEFGDSAYTRKFGGRRVGRSEVMAPVEGIPGVTVVGDLQTGEGVPRDAFDCIVLTQVLLCMYDFHAGVRHCVAALRPGGVILCTLPCISQISRYDQVRWGDFWRFTSRGARALFEQYLPAENVEVRVFGNVLAATAFLQGIVTEELTDAELDENDDEFELIIAVRATRPAGEAVAS